MLSDFEKDLFALRRIYFFKVRWVFFSAQSGAASACWRCLVLMGDRGPTRHFAALLLLVGYSLVSLNSFELMS